MTLQLTKRKVGLTTERMKKSFSKKKKTSEHTLSLREMQDATKTVIGLLYYKLLQEVHFSRYHISYTLYITIKVGSLSFLIVAVARVQIQKLQNHRIVILSI